MGQLRVASYCTTFLKSEMLHIYRQVTSLRRAQTFVMTKKIEHPRRFPFDDIERIPRPHRNLLRHGWMKFVQRDRKSTRLNSSHVSISYAVFCLKKKKKKTLISKLI